MTNPFQTPASQLKHGQFAKRKIFAMTGRIGRLTFLTVPAAINLVLLVFCVWLQPILPQPYSELTTGWPCFVLAVIIVMIYSARRLEDLELSRLLAVFSVLPVLNLLVWGLLASYRGHTGPNIHGLQETPNGAGMQLLFLLTYSAWAGLILRAFYIASHQ